VKYQNGIKDSELVKATQLLSGWSEGSLEYFRRNTRSLKGILARAQVRSPFYYYYDPQTFMFKTDENTVSDLFRLQEPNAYQHLFERNNRDATAKPTRYLHGVGTKAYVDRIAFLTVVGIFVFIRYTKQEDWVTVATIYEYLYEAFKATGQTKLFDVYFGSDSNRRESDSKCRKLGKLVSWLKKLRKFFELKDNQVKLIQSSYLRRASQAKDPKLIQSSYLRRDSQGKRPIPEYLPDIGFAAIGNRIDEFFPMPQLVSILERLDGLLKYAAISASGHTIEDRIKNAEDLIQRKMAVFGAYVYGDKRFIPHIPTSIRRQNQRKVDFWLFATSTTFPYRIHFAPKGLITAERRKARLHERLVEVIRQYNFLTERDQKNALQRFLAEVSFDPKRISHFTFLDMLVLPVALNNSLIGLFLAEYIGDDFKKWQGEYPRMQSLFHQLAQPHLIQNKIEEEQRNTLMEKHMTDASIGTLGALSAHLIKNKIHGPMGVLGKYRDQAVYGSDEYTDCKDAIDELDELSDIVTEIDNLAYDLRTDRGIPFRLDRVTTTIYKIMHRGLLQKGIQLRINDSGQKVRLLRGHYAHLVASMLSPIHNSRIHGKPDIAKEKGENPCVAVTLEVNDKSLQVHICDNLGGMLPRVERDINANKKSSTYEKNGRAHGFGLILMKEIIKDLMEGTTNLENKFKRGVSWHFCIPLKSVE
jgi:hypothetical protein